MSEINYDHNLNIHNTSAAEQILPYIFNIIKVNSVLDVGCGTGSWLKIAKELGSKKIQGVDGIHVDKSKLCISDEEFIKHDLIEPLQLSQKFDLAICLEVAEHLPESSASNIINIVTSHSDIILFSAAIPGQGGQFHVNEQWQDYWQDKFLIKGFLPFDIIKEKFWNNTAIEWWYRQNIVLYANRETQFAKNNKPAKQVLNYVHPELFNLKNNENQYLKKLIRERIWSPKFLPTLKLLVKSIIK